MVHFEISMYSSNTRSESCKTILLFVLCFDSSEFIENYILLGHVFLSFSPDHKKKKKNRAISLLHRERPHGKIWQSNHQGKENMKCTTISINRSIIKEKKI